MIERLLQQKSSCTPEKNIISNREFNCSGYRKAESKVNIEKIQTLLKLAFLVSDISQIVLKCKCVTRILKVYHCLFWVIRVLIPFWNSKTKVKGSSFNGSFSFKSPLFFLTYPPNSTTFDYLSLHWVMISCNTLI